MTVTTASISRVASLRFVNSLDSRLLPPSAKDSPWSLRPCLLTLAGPLCEGLTLVAKTLLAHVGGASGPLYGTGFLRGGRAIAEHPDLGASETIALLYEAIAEGIAHRGNAEAGDKTMLDAWLPAAHAARDACEKGASVDEVLSSAAQAAQRGATLTEGMKALKGRASYLGEPLKNRTPQWRVFLL